jgi:CheY-like chemotaxis protein
MGGPTILLVEDEPSVRDLAAHLLRDEGYEVVEARDGAEAIRALDEHERPADQLAVVLLDMMLPRIDGVGVLRHLAQRAADIPVVAMSASRERLAVATATGARATLAKPFELDQLLTTVAHCCTLHSGPGGPSKPPTQPS